MKNFNLKDEFIKGSIILILLFGLFNLINYLFQIAMAKMLSLADYGVFAAMMSLIYIIAIPSEAIQTVISRYTSKFNVKKEFGKTKDLLLKSTGKAVSFSVLIFISFLIVGIFLSNLLKINFLIILLTGTLIFTSFLSPITRGILQGDKKFAVLGYNLVLETLVRLIFGVGFVLIGLRVYGGILGVLVGAIAGYLFSFIFIKHITAAKRIGQRYAGIYNYNIPGLVIMTAIVLMYSLDILFARILFSPEIAGQYAFVSLIGKAIIFSNISVGKAMFPLASEKFEKGTNTRNIFKKSIIFVSLISAIALILYFIFPEFIIKILSLGSDKYLGASGVLFIIGLAFSLLSISYIIVLYSLSRYKINKKESFYFLFFALIQIVLFLVYHSNIMQFSLALLTSSALFLFGSIILLNK